MVRPRVRSAQVSPTGSMSLLSNLEVERLQQGAASSLYPLFRRCCLAVLNSGSKTDNAKQLLDAYKSFEVNVIRQERGIKLELCHAPAQAFVDGKLIRGLQEHLFAVLRDILYIKLHLTDDPALSPQRSDHITHLVFSVLRHAGAITTPQELKRVVCWGGHSIGHEEFQYTREVGYQMGLRGLDICTGCGPGAMEGPMKGAAIGHAQQRTSNGGYLGLTEPGIIAAEPPNPIVNHLVILPDIEKRLEAFVRLGHGFVLFPGGVGTAEELLYLLGILLHEKNQDQPLPLILTGPAHSADYFKQLDSFVRATLGEQAASRYQIIIDNPRAVAKLMRDAMYKVKQHRKETNDAYHFNWSLHIESEFQHPFEPDHANMSALALTRAQSAAGLAANLRRVFSGIVAGNVKADTITAVEQHGPFQLNADPDLLPLIDRLLQAFIDQGRMKLPGSQYQPCYQLAGGATSPADPAVT